LRIAEFHGDRAGQPAEAIEQGQPRAIELTGPAGIGRSRLLAELTTRADARGHLVVNGSGAELEQDLPFWVFVDALDDYVKGLDPRRLDRIEPAVVSELAQVLPSLADRADPAGAARALPHAPRRQ
jgi:predicted ATPase